MHTDTACILQPLVCYWWLSGPGRCLHLVRPYSHTQNQASYRIIAKGGGRGGGLNGKGRLGATAPDLPPQGGGYNPIGTHEPTKAEMTLPHAHTTFMMSCHRGQSGCRSVNWHKQTLNPCHLVLQPAALPTKLTNLLMQMMVKGKCKNIMKQKNESWMDKKPGNPLLAYLHPGVGGSQLEESTQYFEKGRVCAGL